MSTVTITPEQIAAFRRSWPCSGLPRGVALRAEFDNGGNLTDYAWSDGSDYADAEMSGAMVALMDDARDGKLLA